MPLEQCPPFKNNNFNKIRYTGIYLTESCLGANHECNTLKLLSQKTMWDEIHATTSWPSQRQSPTSYTRLKGPGPNIKFRPQGQIWTQPESNLWSDRTKVANHSNTLQWSSESGTNLHRVNCRIKGQFLTPRDKGQLPPMQGHKDNKVKSELTGCNFYHKKSKGTYRSSNQSIGHHRLNVSL